MSVDRNATATAVGVSSEQQLSADLRVVQGDEWCSDVDLPAGTPERFRGNGCAASHLKRMRFDLDLPCVNTAVVSIDGEVAGAKANAAGRVEECFSVRRDASAVGNSGSARI